MGKDPHISKSFTSVAGLLFILLLLLAGCAHPGASDDPSEPPQKTVAATETPQSSESESGVEASSAKLGGQADPKRGAPLTRHEMVREIQQLLTDLGYTPGPVDGLYGKKTRAAIQAFQVDKNLDPNGQATQQILDALRQSL